MAALDHRCTLFVCDGLTFSFLYGLISFVSGSTQVENIQPFTAKQLSIRSLADCVLDLPQLHVLYPNRPKHEAFRRDYNSELVGEKGRGEDTDRRSSIFYNAPLHEGSSSSPVPGRGRI